ncbi:hypothetical protein D9Q98_005334 [Chlorella vulgaris]|uniref:Uncharacterized protein n=1 Tax=Chlorella vulgaris TaxID=3077 RepID=A0A9D4YW40_CHLVU|nr:hypothetical protein D9Q98_005334 [Chlorella vulgaris]
MNTRAVLLPALAALLVSLAAGATGAVILPRCSTGSFSRCAACRSGICVRCKPGNFKVSRNAPCTECPEWCTSCTSATITGIKSGVCLACEAGHPLQADGTCSAGRRSTCTPGANGCNRCWEGKCAQCKAPAWNAAQHRWDAWGLTSAGTCKKCSPMLSVFSYRCNACSGDLPTLCTSCKDAEAATPMYLDTTNRCQSCSGGCLKCLKGSGKCVDCDELSNWFADPDDDMCMYLGP